MTNGIIPHTGYNKRTQKEFYHSACQQWLYKIPRKYMLIGDINPGYLNRQSLLDEHRQLHRIVKILVHNKKGHSRHAEILRWEKYGWALTIRHQLLVAEMHLRGFNEQSPVNMDNNKNEWPTGYINQSGKQFEILKSKYENKEKGRIPLPHTAQQLWSHHKYSVLARDVRLYKEIGKTVATMSPKDDFSSLSCLLTEKLRCKPSRGGINNALQHMWGYVSKHYTGSGDTVAEWSLQQLLKKIQQLVIAAEEPYLIKSTALSELEVWIEN